MLLFQSVCWCVRMSAGLLKKIYEVSEIFINGIGFAAICLFRKIVWLIWFQIQNFFYTFSDITNVFYIFCACD